MAEELKAGAAETCGNGVVTEVSLEGDRWTVRFMSEPRTSPQPLWFHLEAEGSGGRTVRFLWQNAGSCLGLGSEESLGNVRPVVRLDKGEWRRASTTELEESPAGGWMLAVETPAPCDRAAAAFCYPYGPEEFRRTVAELEGIWTEEHLGLTGGGRVLPAVEARTGAENGERGVYLCARQHAGETPGSWVLDGVLRAVAEPEGDLPLQELRWRAAPFVDLDGVTEGDYGKDALPRDFNRTWSSLTLRPEILAIQRDIRRFADRVQRLLVLDLHAPGGGERGLYYFLPGEERPSRQRRIVEGFLPRLAAEFPELPAERLSRVPNYPSRWSTAQTLGSWVWDALDGVPGVSLETSYHALYEDGPIGREDYRSIGRGVGRAAARWVMSFE